MAEATTRRTSWLSRCSSPSSSRLPSGLVAQGHGARAELAAAHELQVELLGQPREQRRPMTGDPGLHHELVLVDQSELRQGQRKLHAAHEHSPAWALLDPLDRLAEI